MSADKLDEIAERLVRTLESGMLMYGNRANATIRAALDEARQEDQRALVALQQATGSNNTENPWLGVCSAVALLQMGRQEDRAEIESLRAGLLAKQEINKGLGVAVEARQQEVDRQQSEIERLREELKGEAFLAEQALERAEAAEAIALQGKLCISEQHMNLEEKLAEALADNQNDYKALWEVDSEALAVARAKLAEAQAVIESNPHHRECLKILAVERERSRKLREAGNALWGEFQKRDYDPDEVLQGLLDRWRAADLRNEPEEKP